MAFGFETYSSDGKLRAGLSASLPRVLGQMNVNSPGSASDGNISKGTPWWCFLPYSAGMPPRISVSGNIFSWSDSGSGTGMASGILTYGIRNGGNASGGYGFQAGGDNGVQIDGDYRNLALRHAGVITTLPFANVSNPYSGTLRDRTVTLTCDFPIVAVSPPVGNVLAMSGGVRFQYATRSGNNWTFHFYDNGAAACNYYIFDTPQPVYEAFGMQVYNSGSQLVATSAHKYLNLASLAYDQQVPAGRKYAVIQASPGASWYYDQSPDNPDQFYMLRYQSMDMLDNNKLNGYDAVTSYSGPFFSGTVSNPVAGAGLICDVTDM